eukprot:506625-Amphidinium_carterae.1
MLQGYALAIHFIDDIDEGFDYQSGKVRPDKRGSSNHLFFMNKQTVGVSCWQFQQGLNASELCHQNLFRRIPYWIRTATKPSLGVALACKTMAEKEMLQKAIIDEGFDYPSLAFYERVPAFHDKEHSGA